MTGMGLVAGRLSLGETIAIIDIGSNSVRLVVYEMLARSPAQVFNEKEMAGLGRQVATTGRLAEDAMERALEALLRFRILCEAMQVGEIRVIATAAAREAANGPAFLAKAEQAIGQRIELISGGREAYLSGLGVISGFAEPHGVAGDLGGGSLELVGVDGDRVGPGISLPIGGLALMDKAKGQIKLAEKIVREQLDHHPQLAAMRGKDFFAVGGTWRALATLHQRQSGYPLSVMHGYTVPARDVADFARLVERADASVLEAIDAVSSARRPLLAYGALVLDLLIKRGRPRAVVISASGVREGLLYDMLPEDERRVDPLLRGAQDYNQLRAREPRHAADLIEWVQRLVASAGLPDDPAGRRLQDAACLLSDIGWRAHPDYRGEQSLNVIAHAAFSGVDHAGRAFLALTVFHRYAGAKSDSPAAAGLRQLLTPRLLERSQLLAGAFRVAYLLSAGMPGILPRATLACVDSRLVLRLSSELHALSSERVTGRLKQLAKLLGREYEISLG
ncbi:exopolyphosphatase/guanosine-5'-triphosphate,3'-diphosphate pyrophosphatase [Bosea sp. BE125]|uniref:exopolyphosphatase n=1 Tax=Bosea sp. BE125 TaxID=2817909 RepID=UPI002866357B|nr:exopolyphosphatase [Bosea sp. BE125]MDR6871866.1 exopolyphosphatase/guanosine-5'-triphosphate,3'-diphosphate pyrophosphatase [Bosea sp. BE125]